MPDPARDEVLSCSRDHDAADIHATCYLEVQQGTCWSTTESHSAMLACFAAFRASEALCLMPYRTMTNGIPVRLVYAAACCMLPHWAHAWPHMRISTGWSIPAQPAVTSLKATFEAARQQHEQVDPTSLRLRQPCPSALQTFWVKTFRIVPMPQQGVSARRRTSQT